MTDGKTAEDAEPVLCMLSSSSCDSCVVIIALDSTRGSRAAHSRQVTPTELRRPHLRPFYRQVTPTELRNPHPRPLYRQVTPTELRNPHLRPFYRQITPTELRNPHLPPFHRQVIPTTGLPMKSPCHMGTSHLLDCHLSIATYSLARRMHRTTVIDKLSDA